MKHIDPPVDFLAEQSILGSIFKDNDSFVLIYDKIQANYFYTVKHQILFKIMLKLFKGRIPIDMITVSAKLKEGDLVSTVGGNAYILELMDSVFTSKNIEQYAVIVKNKYVLRKMADIGSSMIENSYENIMTAEEILSKYQEELISVNRDSIENTCVHAGPVFTKVFESYKRQYETGETVGVATQFKDLNKLMSFFEQDLVILAADPSVGKTTLALNFIANYVLSLKVPALMFSLESSKEEISERLIACYSQIPIEKIKNNELTTKQRQHLTNVKACLEKAPFFIDDKSGLSPMMMKAKAKRLIFDHDIKLIVIDHIQLAKASNKTNSRVEEVGSVIREIKELAKETKTTVLGISTLNRESNKQQRKPRLSDLKESGEIEYTADIVIFLHTEEAGDTQNIVSANIEKHRDGPTGSINLLFKKDIYRFFPMDRR